MILEPSADPSYLLIPAMGYRYGRVQKHMQKALKQPNFNTLKTFESLVIGFKESFKPLPPTVYAKLEKTLLKTARYYMQHPALENSSWSNKIVIDWRKKNAKGFKYPPPEKMMHGH